MFEIRPERTVGELVAERPSRSRVFERFQIDYCCGGKRSLADACAGRRLDPALVIAALRDAERPADEDAEPDWTTAPLADLIANIVERHHAFLRLALPRISELAEKVRHAHAAGHPELDEVGETFQDLRVELESHMRKEEQVLFPVVAAMEAQRARLTTCFGTVGNPIRMMEHEHDVAGAALKRLRTLTRDYRPPGDACNSYRALLAALAELETDLHVHIHKENNVLFPRAIELEGELSRQQAGALS